MSKLISLQKKYDSILTLYDKYLALVQKEPNNYSHKMSFATIEKHVKELQLKIYKEKAAREKEVIELKLNVLPAYSGTLPLQLLGEIAGHLSWAVLSASQKIKEGDRLKGKIPHDIVQSLDLRFAGLSAGSSKIYLTGNVSPDLFGNSLIEDALEKIFTLLNSGDSEKLTESASAIGIRSVIKISKLLKSIAGAELDMEVAWYSPLDKHYGWKSTKDEMICLSNSLDKIKASEPEIIDVEAKLIMASLKGYFEIETMKRRSYRGAIPSRILGEIQAVHLGDICRVKIEKKMMINQVTEFEKAYYTLLEIKAITNS